VQSTPSMLARANIYRERLVVREKPFGLLVAMRLRASPKAERCRRIAGDTGCARGVLRHCCAIARWGNGARFCAIPSPREFPMMAQIGLRHWCAIYFRVMAQRHDGRFP
jgi:hypothetical protein